MSDQVSGQFSVDSSDENGMLFTNDQQSMVSVAFTASSTWNTGSKIDYGPEGKVGARNNNSAYPNSTLYALVAVNSNNKVVGEGTSISLTLQPDESVRFVVNDTHYANNSGQLTIDWQINATATRELPAASEINDKSEQALENPTWLGDIRYFFENVDIEHMNVFGMDVATYAGVKAKAESIYVQTKPPHATMPMDPARHWSQARSDTFYNWMRNDYPFGTPKVQVNLSSVDPRATRIRKDIRTLSDSELDKLKQAFEGIMALDPKGPNDPVNPNSYFAIAGIHGLPDTKHCLHIDDKFLPWHRIYMQVFEDALRSVLGCEDVTLPYWDITQGIPSVLYEPPFDKYIIPEDIGANNGLLRPDNSTWRNSITHMQHEIDRWGIPEMIEDYEVMTTWNRFHAELEDWPHGVGHLSAGPTMSDTATASFDPIFWFFHANWDRLWWKWQLEMDGTDLNGFLSTIECPDPNPEPEGQPQTCPPSGWLTANNHLPPFTSSDGIRVDDTIDLVRQFSVDYAQPANVRSAKMLKRTRGSTSAHKTIRLSNSLKASVRVKGIDRLNIPGSFILHLQADGESIARRAFFQSRTPEKCSNCRSKALVNFDFVVEVDQLRERNITVAIELAHSHWISRWVPLSLVGDPTVNVRLLLHDE